MIPIPLTDSSEDYEVSKKLFFSINKGNPVDSTTLYADPIFFGKYPELEVEIETFAKKYEEYKNPRILQLEKEVQFYLAFFTFQKEWEAQGAVFSTPILVEAPYLRSIMSTSSFTSSGSSMPRV